MMPRRKRKLASRIRHYVRSFLAFLFSNVGVIVLVFAYTSAGASMFQAIEGASETEQIKNMTRERNNTAEYLWQNVTLTLNLFNETALKERVGAELSHYQRKVVSAARRGWDGGRSPRQWSFSSSFLYSLTVITTIGYGHLSPRTSWGKVVTIFYALLGMPLFLLYLSNVGELLASWCKCVYALLCLCKGCRGLSRRRIVHIRTQLELSDTDAVQHRGWRAPDSPIYGPRSFYLRNANNIALPSSYYWEQSSAGSSGFTYVTFDVQTITVPISACVSILVGYVMFGSMIFGMWEKWDKLDGAYFCFISLSSIGFGDFVPGERVYTPRIETSFIVCSLYLMLGMALVAMCFNLMQEQVIHYYAGLKRALKRMCRCKR